MRTPSPPYCRLDLAPPLADQFIFGVAPIDYSPVLLLMPFGFHLTMDTLAVRLTIPPVGFVGDFHSLVRAPCRAHQQKGPRMAGLKNVGTT